MLARVMAVAIITIGLDGSPWMIQFTYDSCWILDKSTPETFRLWRGGMDPPLWATCHWCSPGQTSQGCMSAAPATLAMIKSLSTLYKVTSVDITLSGHTEQKQKFHKVHHGSQSISCHRLNNWSKALPKSWFTEMTYPSIMLIYVVRLDHEPELPLKIAWMDKYVDIHKAHLWASMGLSPFWCIHFQYCQCNSTIYSLLKTSFFFTILEGNL